MSEQQQDPKQMPRSVTGTVVSTKMNKSISVRIERKVPHPLYKKYVRRSTTIHAHDEHNQCKEGDAVTIQQCRPMSKTKTWKLVKILETAG